MFLFLLVQRTSFCADVEELPSEDGGRSKQTIKRRWSLEIPFHFVAATVYVFTFFNMKHGKTWYLLAPYHVLMFAENVAMGVLFYVQFSHLMYAQAALTVVASLYPVGMFFMVIYFCLCHPERTEDWYWVGVPRSVSCCGSSCCCRCLTAKQGQDSIGFRNRTSVIISGPTLISHNGFLPDNMIPAGVPSSPPPQDIGEVVDGDGSRQRNVRGGTGTDGRIGNGHHHGQDARNPLSSLATTSPDSAHGNVGPRSLTTPTESNRSNPVFSDVNSQFLPSELDTDVDSNMVLGEGANIDTVIDSPLVGFTPEPFDLHAVQMLQHNGRMKSVESQKADTNDTGIDVESDAVLTPGTAGKVEDSTGHHRFPDIPAKKKNYLTERSKLEQHYFPEEKHQRNRDSGSITPTLPTPNWSQSPASTSPHSGRATWGQRMSDSSPERHRRNVTPGTVSSQSQQSPARLRRGPNAPRSPKGAKAFTINQAPAGSTNYQSDSSEGWSGYPSSGHDRRRVAPRSPKGAKRLMITPQLSVSSSASAQFSATQQQQPFAGNPGQVSERQMPYYPPSPHRSPARQPRGAGGHTYHHSSPERKANINVPVVGAMPQHVVPKYTITTSNNQSYPAHRSPVRVPAAAGVAPNYHQSLSSGEASGHSHTMNNAGEELQWDSWTAENTHINAAQAATTTHLRVEGSGVGRGGSLLHKEMSPSARSESAAAEVERNRSFNVPRKTLNVNPYYSPHIPKRSNVDAELQGSNYPQLRRAAGRDSNGSLGVHTSGFQHQYPRYSGEYNPRFSTELDNRLHVPGGHQGRISESYPSPAVTARHSGPPVVHRSPRYPRTPQGVSGRAPRMARSPPDKRLKSMSPQRSIISYGSGVSGGGWPVGEGGARGGASISSRPNSVHSGSAFSPQHRRLQQPGGATRHSDGASAVAWVGPNMHWPTAVGGRRSPRMNPVLHVPQSSAHESVV